MSLVSLTSDLLIKMARLTSYLLIRNVVALISNLLARMALPALTFDLIVKKTCPTLTYDHVESYNHIRKAQHSRSPA